jgi:K+/H+ antiporter YhaU regulatory subunit KhtT
MQQISSILEANPEVKKRVCNTNPLMSELYGMSFGIEEDFPEE